MEEDEDTLPMAPPFWLPNGQTNHHHHRHRYLRRSYSLLLTSTSLLILLLVTALTFIFIIVPTLLSFASHIFKPHTVKKSWDYLNLLLVLFAIVCGFLSKKNTNENETPRSHNQEEENRSFSKPNPETAQPWYEYPDHRSVYSYKSFSRLRSFNSYPDLRHDSPWVAADDRWQFHDDTHLGGCLLRHRQQTPEEEKEEEKTGIENVASVTSGEVPTAPPQTPPSPPPQTPPSPPPEPRRAEGVRRNAKRTYRAVGQVESDDFGAENLQPPPSTRPPPPPPPPPPLTAEVKTVQGKKKRGNATKEFLTSLRRKKKKQRQRSVENFETILNYEPFPPPPSPPPSPPPPSVFHSLFPSKKSKHKKQPQISSMRVSKTKPRSDGVATHKPLLSNKREHSYSLEDSVITGNESPLIPIPPPPPPPPPFKMAAWKFRVQGDYVRIDSIGSSRSGSPDLDEVVDSPTSQEASQCNNPSAGEPAATSLFCPSPDVDTKAHTFIERFRAGLRMEKMNSMKEKQGIGRSNLGPSPNPETKEETRTS